MSDNAKIDKNDLRLLLKSCFEEAAKIVKGLNEEISDDHSVEVNDAIELRQAAIDLIELDDKTNFAQVIHNIVEEAVQHSSLEEEFTKYSSHLGHMRGSDEGQRTRYAKMMLSDYILHQPNNP